jgi:hypothetical protein
MITVDELLKLIPSKEKERITNKTTQLWHRIYCYVEASGNADTVEDDAFESFVRRRISVSSATLARHLLKMEKVGVLEGHVLLRKADSLTNGLCNPYSANPLPSRFKRYTLPGQKPSLRMRKAEKILKKFSEADWDKELAELADATKLLRRMM